MLDPAVLGNLPPRNAKSPRASKSGRFKVPAENSKAIPVNAKDEAEARPLDLLGVGELAHAKALDVDTKGPLRDIHRRVGTAIFPSCASRSASPSWTRHRSTTPR